MIAIIIVVGALILLALINTGMDKVTEMADVADTKESHGCAFVFGILLILIVLALTGVALNETVPKRPGTSRTQIADVIVRETPQPQLTGWPVEVRWRDEEYTSDRSFTQVQGVILSKDDLAKAMQLADEWETA